MRLSGVRSAARSVERGGPGGQASEIQIGIWHQGKGSLALSSMRRGSDAMRTAPDETPSTVSTGLGGNKGGEIGDFGGSSLERPRPWLGSHWPGPTPGVPELYGAARRALRSRRGRAGALPRAGQSRFDRAGGLHAGQVELQLPRGRHRVDRRLERRRVPDAAPRLRRKADAMQMRRRCDADAMQT